MRKTMKQIACLILALCLLIAGTVSADTGGSGNVDHGGGGIGSGDGASYWNPGDEGVRVTVVRAADHTVVTVPIDFTNKALPAGIYHFGRISKLHYNGGVTLVPTLSGYNCTVPAQPIPKIITSASGASSIEAIKQYFCSEYVVKRIADITGMNYGVLIGGDYKILLEPIAYLTFQGVMIAMTATEAALYDEAISGQLRGSMGSLTHKNLPLAMFLEVSDLGYPAWHGSTTTNASNADIKSSLGLGIIRFTERPEPPTVTTYDYEYRTNTEVITSVDVSGGQSDPDNPATVQFEIGDRTYTVENVFYPDGDSQLAWVRWTTPPTAQDMIITVRVSGVGTAQGLIRCKIVELKDNPPPNPVADDRNDAYVSSPLPNRPHAESASWGIWQPNWNAYWVWHRDGEDGRWCDHGWWDFTRKSCAATLTTSMRIECDTQNPTAAGRTMKSGYGVRQATPYSIASNQASAVTPPQHAVSYFPEFGYRTYWRLLDRVGAGLFVFRKNPYSTYGGRTHFTPIWMLDGPYTINTWVLDAWTPVGMLSANLSDSLSIQGNLWQDWHSAPKKS